MEILQLADQPHRALALIAAGPGFFARQGSVVGSYRMKNGQRFGPYYRLIYRLDGRQCSVYLGRDADLAERVRAALAAVQGPLKLAREYRRIEQAALRSLRIAKFRMNLNLAPLGLRMKGAEVRGWRRLRRNAGWRPPRFAARLRRLPRLPCIKSLTAFVQQQIRT